MNEEKKAERIIEKKAGEDTDAGNQPDASSIVERADAAAERLEKANEERRALLEREEKIMARKALGGDSTISKPEPKKEETPAEFKARFLRGEVDNPFR